MLSERSGFVEYELTDLDTGERWTLRPDDIVEVWQAGQIVRRPDLILAGAHLVADELARDGRSVAVRADAWVAFNGRPRQRWIDPSVDLAALDRGAPASAYVLPEYPAVRS